MNDVATTTTYRTPGSLRRFFLATFAAVALTVPLVPTPAFAQTKAATDAAPPTRGYTLPYLFTIMAVAAVVAPLCWPAMRRWDLPVHGQDED